MLYLFSVIVCRTAIESCSVDRLQHACTSIRYACWSRQAFHAIHSAHSCGNTHCICTVVNCLHIPAKTPTQVATLEDWLHNFAGLIPPQKCFVKDATQPTAALIPAQFFGTLLYTWRSLNVLAANSSYIPTTPGSRGN